MARARFIELRERAQQYGIRTFRLQGSSHLDPNESVLGYEQARLTGGVDDEIILERLDSGGTTIAFGEFGIQALEPAYLTNRQIEAARIAMTRHIKRGGKVWINIYPDRPITKKPAETRMGSGKGSPEWWIANVKPGRVLFELAGVPEPLAREAMRRAQHKLPMKTRFVRRDGGDA